MKQILIVRHGESLEDINNNIYAEVNDFDIPLTVNGVRQSISLAKALKDELIAGNTILFHSCCKRVVQTAGIIFNNLDKLIQKRIIDDRLSKQDWGTVTLKNRKFHEIERYKAGVLNYRFPEGESGSDVVERSRDFLDYVNQMFVLHNVSNVIVVTHGFNYRTLLKVLLDINDSGFEQLANPKHCAMNKVSILGNKVLYYSPLEKYNRDQNTKHIAKAKTSHVL